MCLLYQAEFQEKRKRFMTNRTQNTQPLFKLGQIVATPGALELLTENNVSPSTLLVRHVSGDWGDMDDEDKKSNDDAVKYGNRTFSAYVLPDGDKVWIITESDRSYTTILKPEEY